MRAPFTFDPTGFPLLRIPRFKVEVHLLPVTKVQLEQFLATPHGYGDRWYEELLRLNPRVSYHEFGDQQREQLFCTGILPSEAQAFAAWLGPGFSLPTEKLWRRIFRYLENWRPEWTSAVDQILQDAPSIPQRILIQLNKQFGRVSPRQAFLWEGGVLEWASGRGESWAGLGAPRQTFYPNLFDPLSDSVHPIRGAERQKHFGFRLVRNL